MSDSGRADEVYQPADGGDEQADATALDLQNALDERTYDEILDEGWSPPDKPLAVQRTGTTAGEQRSGGTLDERLARELPDREPDRGGRVGDLPGGASGPVGPGTPAEPDTEPDSGAGTERAGRLVAPDEGAHPRTAQLYAEDLGVDAGAATAEEAAVHIVADRDLVDDRGTTRPRP
ncbi:DUF5709 domain-containing protein [Kitasatospora camelliae]|uniref:DUF5709 domain-containing protein n=1 Tax=Kitasatospora camelliae TaxID=3156397 RepID=A0AAU8K490_9ACTN